MRINAMYSLRRTGVGAPVIAQGIALAFLTATISGFAIFVNSYAVKEFSSPAVFSTVKNTLVGLAFLALLLRPAALREVRRLTPRRGLGLVLLGVIGGSVPFVLFFEGLSRVVSGNAAFIHKTLFLWVAVLAVVFLRERLGRGQLAALGLLLFSQVLMGGPGALRPGLGETLILIATLLWTIEVVLAKRLLGTVSSSLGATGRMAIGAVVLLGYLALTGKINALGQLTLFQWAWVIGTGLILFGYVTSWYAALKRAPATAVTCVLTVGAPITATLSALVGKGIPQPEQILGYVILVAAVLLFATLSLRRPVPHLAGA